MVYSSGSGVDATRVERLRAAENARFVAEPPVSTARLERARSKYHGHLDATMMVLDDGVPVPEYDGLPRGIEAGIDGGLAAMRVGAAAPRVFRP